MDGLATVLRRTQNYFLPKSIGFGLFWAFVIAILWYTGAKDISISELHDKLESAQKGLMKLVLITLILIHLSSLFRIQKFSLIDRFLTFLTMHIARFINFIVGILVGLLGIFLLEKEFGLVIILLYAMLMPATVIFLVELLRHETETNREQIAINYPTLSARQVITFDIMLNLSLLSVWIVLLYRLWH